MCREFLRWWPYYNGHYLLNKGTDLVKLFNDYDSNQVMDMIDNLIVEDSVYDEANQGLVLKKRAALNKDYGRIGIAIDDTKGLRNGGHGAPEYLEPDEEGFMPGLEGIPMMGG